MMILAILLVIAGIVVFFVGNKLEAVHNKRTKEGRGYQNDFMFPYRLIAPIAIGLGIVLAFLSTITLVPAGHVGVPVVFGSVQKHVVSEGIGFVNPFADVEKMSVRSQTYTMSGKEKEGQVQGDDSIGSLSKDGLLMTLEVSVAYQLASVDAPWVYQNLGLNYVDDVIRPAARSAIRDAVRQFDGQDAYSTKRAEVEVLMFDRMVAQLHERFKEYKDFKGVAINIQQVLLRDIELPGKIKDSIEQKLQAQQENERMTFVLAKERQEADRKEIEAGGIKKFQDIVRQGIDEQLLRWKGIEATIELAKSPNSKVVIIGSAKDGMPIILGNN